jgi:hypothetical protein
MKRAFLFGLGAALIVIGIGHIAGNVDMPRWVSTVIAVVALIAGVITVVVAKKATPHRSWAVKVGMWLAGYVALTVVGLGVLETIRIVPLILR